MMSIARSPILPEEFKRESASRYVEVLRNEFDRYFSQRGYVFEPARRVTDAKSVDSSTRFIGSHTSVLKPYIYGNNIPEAGIRIVQPCFQAQNLADFDDEAREIFNGSVFECHGLLVRNAQLETVTRDVDTYLQETLGLRGRIVYHVRSVDVDLSAVAVRVLTPSTLEFDSLPADENRHQFGDSRLAGRDIRIDIFDVEGKRLAMGVIIAMSLDGRPHCVEVALAPGRVIQSLYQRSHYLDVFPLIGLTPLGETAMRKVEDCLVGVVLLAREGLRPGGSENKRKIMRSYLKFLERARMRMALTSTALREVIATYERLQYGNVVATEHIIAAICPTAVAGSSASSTEDHS